MSKQFSIITYNVGLFYAMHFGRVLGPHFMCPVGKFWERRLLQPRELIKTGADILCLQEVYHQDDKAWYVSQLQDEYPYYRFDDRKWGLRAGNDLMIFSKYPITKHILYQQRERPGIEFFSRNGFTISHLDIDGYEVVVTHTHATIGGWPYTDNWAHACWLRGQQFDRMLDRASAAGSTILLGDLNCGPWSCPNNFEQLLAAGYSDVWTDAERAKTVTYPGESEHEHHLFSDTHPEQLDHLIYKSDQLELVSKKLVMTKELGNPHLSDHFGIKAEFSIK